MGGDVLAEHAGIERLRARNVADLKMHMADDAAVGEAVPGGDLALGGHQRLQVERIRAHRHRAIRPAPFLARPVDIDFDAVALGIGEVDRLADQMIGRPLQSPARLREMGQPLGEMPARRQQEGGVEQTGVAPCMPPGGRVAAQLDHRRVAGAEQHRLAVFAEQAKADGVLVELADKVQIMNRQRHLADARHRGRFRRHCVDLLPDGDF
jgi:hypothetical protein